MSRCGHGHLETDFCESCRDADRRDNAKLREDYNELLYHVAKKHPDETRHQTALRYIKQAETSDNSVASKSQKAVKR